MAYDISTEQALGDNEVTVDSIGFTDKGDGNIVLNIRVKFSNGEIGNKDLYPFSSDKSMQVTRKTLSVMGFNLTERSLDEIFENPALLKGTRVWAVIEEHEYQGKVSNRIAWINAKPSVKQKPVDKLALANLTMKLRQVKKEDFNASL